MNLGSLKRKSRRRVLWTARHAKDYVCKQFSNAAHLPVYWSYSDNFGEWITALIFKQMGVCASYSPVEDAKVASTGSILEHLPHDYAGIILGSGFISETSRVAFDHAQVLAIRGYLTAERISSIKGQKIVMGDPGLLAGCIGISEPKGRKYKVGVIPHYSDYHLRFEGALKVLEIQNRGDVLIIDVQQSPVTVIRQIMRCETVLSSSLHGLIVADALGIPTRWIEFSTLVGGHFKFHDYYSSLGISCKPFIGLTGSESLKELIGGADLKPADELELRKNELLTLFKRISMAAINGELS